MTVAGRANDSTTKDGFVYVIGHDGSSVVKIGKADDVAFRLARIQAMSPVKLQELARFDGGFDLETPLHKRFKHLRTHGEWFDFCNLDPVTEVSKAVDEIRAEKEAERNRLVEAEATDDSATGAEVYMINGRLWVMPSVSDGGWRCVGRNSNGRRCKGWVSVDVVECGPTWVEWVLYGLGCVNGASLDELASHAKRSLNDIRGQALRQLCNRHFAETSETAAEPAWQPFDPVVHRDLIREFGHADVALAPGFDDFHRRVRAFAAKLLAS